MAISKVIYGDDTLIDITDSTIESGNMLNGTVGYTSAGVRTVGSVTVPTDLDDLSDVTITSPSDGQALVYDDGEWVNGSTANTVKSFYGTCDTAGDNATKVVTLANTDGWELKAGVIVGVKFSYNNSASNVTLNVNSSGDKSIYFGNAVYTSTSIYICGAQNYIIYYMYDGTYWCFLNISNNFRDSDTHRPINVNGTQLLGNNTTAVNFKNGSNVTITGSGADVTIAATDTTYTASKENIGSASTGTAIAADDITAWTTNTPTVVTKKTVVVSGTTTDVPNISKNQVVTSASGATASYSNGILTITDGSFQTGDSVTVGTPIKAYTKLTTGDSVDVTAGTAATLDYTARSIPNISVATKSVVTGITAS